MRARGVQVLRRSEVIKGKKQTNKQIGTWDFLSLAKNSRLRGVHDRKTATKLAKYRAIIYLNEQFD